MDQENYTFICTHCRQRFDEKPDDGTCPHCANQVTSRAEYEATCKAMGALLSLNFGARDWAQIEAA